MRKAFFLPLNVWMLVTAPTVDPVVLLSVVSFGIKYILCKFYVFLILLVFKCFVMHFQLVNSRGHRHNLF